MESDKGSYILSDLALFPLNLYHNITQTGFSELPRVLFLKFLGRDSFTSRLNRKVTVYCFVVQSVNKLFNWNTLSFLAFLVSGFLSIYCFQ